MKLETCLTSAVQTLFPFSKQDRYMVMCDVLSYITGVINAYTFQHSIKKYCDVAVFSAKRFRLSLVSSGYVAVDLKLFVYNLCKGLEPKEAKRKFNISVKDYNFIRKFLTEQPKFKRRIKQHLKSIPIQHLSVQHQQRVFEHCYSQVVPHVKRKVGKKLSFIMKSNNIDKTDFYSELNVKLVTTFNKLMPSKFSIAYIANYLRRTATNYVLNIIDTFTTKKRARLVSSGDSFDLKVVSENQTKDLNVLAKVAAPSSEIEALESEKTVSKVVAKYQSSSRKSKILFALMGVYDNDFTFFLRKRKEITERQTNVDYQMLVPRETFNKALAKYLKIKVTSIHKFINKLKNDLGVSDVRLKAA